jgi:hypothetical protein
MILYIVFPIIIGVGFIGVLAFSNERYPDALKVLKILGIAAIASVFIT